MSNELSLSEHIRACVADWVKDPYLNPHKCKIEMHSAYPVKDKPGEFQINFDCTYSYSPIIQGLLTPFYIFFSLFSMHEGVEYLEDISYFKRLTPIGIRKKRAWLKETKDRFMSLIEQECKQYCYNKL